MAVPQQALGKPQKWYLLHKSSGAFHLFVATSSFKTPPLEDTISMSDVRKPHQYYCHPAGYITYKKKSFYNEVYLF